MKRNEEFRRGCEWTLFSYYEKVLKTWQVTRTLNMQISNLGWSPSGPISRKRLCLVVKCRRSFSNVLWWNVAPFKLKFDIRSQYWFFLSWCLRKFIEIKFYVSSYHCFRHNHYVNQLSNQRTNVKSPKEPKAHSLFVHNAISVFLWGFFFCLYVFYLCVCVCVFVSALSH